MDWKNVLAGAADVRIIPRERIEVGVQQLVATVERRSHADGISIGQALILVQRERKLGMFAYSAGTLGSVVLTAVCAFRFGDLPAVPTTFASALFVALIALPIVVDLRGR